MSAVLLSACLLLQDPPPPEDDAARKARQARQALEWLEDSDPELREVGRQALRKMGADAVPFIEARLAEKGAAELARMLREIESRGNGDGRAVRAEDLPPPADPPKGASRTEREAADRYVQAKYAEAYQLVQRKQYQRAYDLAGALLVLEPRAAASDSVRKLRRHCDNMIMQTSLMEARIVQQKAAYLAGERVDLQLRLRNIHRGAIKILYNAGPVDKPSGGRAVVQVEVRIPQERGDVVTLTANEPMDIEAEIPIATGAQWERGFVLDTSVGAEHADYFQIYVVHAWTIPDKIDAEGIPVTRRIQFEPAVVKMVPRKYAKMMEDPLGSFLKAVESTASTKQEVFVSALLLEGEAKEKGIAKLIEVMRGAERATGRVWIGNLLGFMTDQKLGDDWKKWEEWFKARAGRDNDREKK